MKDVLDVCKSCNGSGVGIIPDSICNECNGSGESWGIRESMTEQERNTLIQEREELDSKIKKSDFVSPIDMRRIDEIRSLLLTDGQSDELRLSVGKMRDSKRVTSFTKDRR